MNFRHKPQNNDLRYQRVGYVLKFTLNKWIIIGFLCLLIGLREGPEARADNPEVYTKPLALDLIEQIDSWRTDRKINQLKVAVWPTRQLSETPVPLLIIQKYDQSLLSTIIRLRPKWLKVIGRKELASVIENQAEITGNYDDALNIVVKNSTVDVLLIPTVQLEKDFLTISYTAVSASEPNVGEIIAKTIVQNVDRRSISKETLLNHKIAQAAEMFSNFASNIRVLYLRPILMETESVNCQSKFSEYVHNHISNGVNNHFFDRISSRNISIRKYEPKNSTEDDGTYVLEGMYWKNANEIDLLLTLRQLLDGKNVSWTGTVHLPEYLIRTNDHILVFEAFISDEIIKVVNFIKNICGYHSHKPQYVRNRRAVYTYTTTHDSAQLTNSLRKISDTLGIQAKIFYKDNKIFVRKIK